MNRKLRTLTKKQQRIIIIATILLFTLSIVLFNQWKKDTIVEINQQATVTLDEKIEVKQAYTQEALVTSIKTSELLEGTTIVIEYDGEVFETITFDTLGDITLKVLLKNEKGDVTKDIVTQVIDTTGPEIIGDTSKTIVEGDPLELDGLFSANDLYDGDVEVTYSLDEVDTNTPGTYTVVLKATDSSGNITEKNFDIIVESYEVAETPTLYISNESPNTSSELSKDLNEQLDEIIAEITNDNMSNSEKASAVYNWMQNNLQYRAGASNSNSISTNAEELLNSRRGQCQHWAALSASFMERMGISYTYIDGLGHNLDGGYSYHAWIKVQGLHFDPLYGVLYGTTQFDQVSSDFVLNTKGSHDWDTSVYGD